jgi:hypothetical protein
VANILYHYLLTVCSSRCNVSAARRLCCNSLAIHVLLKRSKDMEVIVPHAFNHNYELLRLCGHLPYNPDLAPSYFHLFEPIKNQLAA